MPARGVRVLLAALSIVLPAGLLVGVGAAGSAPGPTSSPQIGQSPPTPTPYRAPIPGALVVRHGFQAPATAYSAGHRGVDLAAAPGQAVLAAGPGRVSFAGAVAGRGVVVVAHPDGTSTEYEPVSPAVRAGALVAAGQPIGTLAGSSCAGASCLHWGAKRSGRYLDPLSLLPALGPVRLLPDAA